MILIDTNVLVYAINSDSPRHQACRVLLMSAGAGELPCVLVPQILLEMYAIVTDARRIARPLEPEKAQEVADSLRGIIPVLETGRGALDRLAEVIREKPVCGGDIFDAWIVAQMRALGIDSICTYNTKDFEGFRGIRPFRPEELAGA